MTSTDKTFFDATRPSVGTNIAFSSSVLDSGLYLLTGYVAFTSAVGSSVIDYLIVTVGNGTTRNVYGEIRTGSNIPVNLGVKNYCVGINICFYRSTTSNSSFYIDACGKTTTATSIKYVAASSKISLIRLA